MFWGAYPRTSWTCLKSYPTNKGWIKKMFQNSKFIFSHFAATPAHALWAEIHNFQKNIKTQIPNSDQLTDMPDPFMSSHPSSVKRHSVVVTQQRWQIHVEISEPALHTRCHLTVSVPEGSGPYETRLQQVRGANSACILLTPRRSTISPPQRLWRDDDDHHY